MDDYGVSRRPTHALRTIENGTEREPGRAAAALGGLPEYLRLVDPIPGPKPKPNELMADEMASWACKPAALPVRTRRQSTAGSPPRPAEHTRHHHHCHHHHRPPSSASPSASPLAAASDLFHRPRRATFGDSDQSVPQQYTYQHQHPLPRPPHQHPASSDPPHSAPRIARSSPIAIQLPPRRRAGTVYTPPEPLSARGDLPGGYFPFHEDIRPSYKPHPFDDAAAKNAGPSNDHTSAPEPESPVHGLAVAEQSPVPDFFHFVSNTASSSVAAFERSASTSVSMVMSIPLGKYHPSNYKNKDRDNLPAISTTSATANPQQPTSQHRNSGCNHPSDVRKKLKQYQRDIIEQAAIAGGVPIPGLPKPPSPRLKPLTSPGVGPMTPMELESETTITGGYLVAGARVDVDESQQRDMIKRMIRTEGGVEHEDVNGKSNSDVDRPVATSESHHGGS